MTLSETINIVYVGAGAITFGVPYEPWNHSKRVEQVLGTTQRVVAIIDPSQKRFNEIMDEKKHDKIPGYEATQWFSNLQDAHAAIGEQQIDLFIIGAPPQFRGTTIPGRDIELEAIRLFGTKPTYFNEKPVAAARPDEPNKVAAILEAAEDKPVIGVGYMMRYLKVVQQAKKILRERNLTPLAITARYGMAYNFVDKPLWWAKSGMGGPAVEQMTHFCDLLAYLGGPIVHESVRVSTVENYEPAGKQIAPTCIDESKIDVLDRVPRATAIQWKFESGAIAAFTHTVSLHGKHYSDEVCIIADGHQLRIVNVYSNPILYVRDPEHELEELVYEFEGDDMFYDELSAFISVAARRSGKPDPTGNSDLEILTSYEEACKTYELTWKIRDASDMYAEHWREFISSKP